MLSTEPGAGQNPLRLVKVAAEFRPKEQVSLLPKRLRGIYVLYKQRTLGGRNKFDVLYVGMARRGGIRGRLESHARSVRKKDLWTHFSAFVAWDNIRDEEIAELEGLFRQIYRKDSKASALNIQRGFKKIKAVRHNNLKTWPRPPSARA